MFANSLFTNLTTKLHGLWLDHKAVTAIEYALIAALIAVVVISAVTNVGHGASNTFGRVANGL